MNCDRGVWYGVLDGNTSQLSGIDVYLAYGQLFRWRTAIGDFSLYSCLRFNVKIVSID